MRTEIVLACVVVQMVLIVFLFVGNRRGVRAREILAKRYSLERLISEWSTDLISASLQDLDRAIETGMTKVLQIIGAGRICWYSIDEGSTTITKHYSVTKPNVGPSPSEVSRENIPFTFERLMRGDIIVLHSPNDLPPDAFSDRQYLRDVSIDGLILIPSTCGTAKTGILGIAAVSRNLGETDELLSQLAVLNNLIVTTIERKVVHELLRKSEQRFRCLFQEAPIGIALESIDGKLLFVNPALCSILGYTEEELLNRRCADFSDHDVEDYDLVLFQQLQEGAIGRYNIEKRFIRKDGAKIWGRVDVSLLKNQEQKMPLVIGMVEDITDRKNAEQELQRTRSELQQLAGHLIQAQEEERHRISRELHDDISQRLALISVELDLLSASLDDSGWEKESFQSFQLKMQIDNLTTDIHQLSHQLHSAKLHSLGLPVALEELCKHVSRQHKIAVDFKPARPDYSFPPEVSLCFFRVAQEALNNVIRHSKAGRVSVHLSSEERLFRLAIEDSGVGFDTSANGQGIGLVSMRERLRLIGGQLTVYSAQGQGTQVTAEVLLAGARTSAA
jgi:PAS domain S-box-containing protein